MRDSEKKAKNRAGDIRTTFSYLGVRLQQLGNDLRRTETTPIVPDFLSNQVADILTNCRDCLDWCASDLADVANLSDVKAIYFPFSRKMMKESKFIKLLAASRPDIHGCLLDLVARVESDQRVQGLDVSYGTLERLRACSKHKRHNIQLYPVRHEQSGTRVSYPNGQTMSMKLWEVDDFRDIERTAPTPDAWVCDSPEATLEPVSEYRLTFNNWEVLRFCDHCIRIVVVVLDEIYGKFFDELHSFHPRITEQMARVELIDRTLGHLIPFCWHPMKIAFCLGESVSSPIDVDFGSTAVTLGDLRYQAIAPAAVRLAFTVFELQLRQIEDYLLDNVAKLGVDKPWRFRFETPQAKSQMKFSREGWSFEFDRVIFWMEVRFKMTNPVQFTDADASLAMKMARALFPPTARYGVMNSEGKGVWLEVGPLGHQIVNELEESADNLE